MPNLQGASPVGRDEGGRSYVAQAVGRSRPGQSMLWDGGNPQRGSKAAVIANLKYALGLSRAAQCRHEAAGSGGAR